MDPISDARPHRRGGIGGTCAAGTAKPGMRGRSVVAVRVVSCGRVVLNWGSRRTTFRAPFRYLPPGSRVALLASWLFTVVRISGQGYHERQSPERRRLLM